MQQQTQSSCSSSKRPTQQQRRQRWVRTVRFGFTLMTCSTYSSCRGRGRLQVAMVLLLKGQGQAWWALLLQGTHRRAVSLNAALATV
jgi:hypothetical protein